MGTTCIILMGAILTLFSATASDFSAETANMLLERVGKTKLTTGERNKRSIDGALSLMQQRFPGCNPRVCFALDGSSSLSEKEFLLQKTFVALVAAVLIGPVGGKAAAVQYSGVIDVISPLTGNMLGPPNQGFVDLVLASVYIGNPKLDFRPAVEYCEKQIRRDPGGTNAIVVLADGESTFRMERRLLNAVDAPKAFMGINGQFDVCAVQVGRGKNLVLNLVGTNPEKLLRVKRWERLSDVLKKLVTQVCG